MKRYIILAVIAVTLGCAASGTRLSKEDIQKIKEGETTRAQVIEMLGAPPISTLGSDGKEIFTYHFSSLKMSPQNFIPVVGLIQSRTNMNIQMTHILFTKDGIVEKITSTDSQSNIRSGLITE